MELQMNGCLDELYDLLETEISGYRRLIHVLKKKSECLRKRSIDGLIQVVKEMDSMREEILRVQLQIQKSIGEILEMFGAERRDQTLSDLLAVLPPGCHRRIKSYQRNLFGLKERARQINGQNTAFMQESLANVKELISLLTQPVSEFQGYLQTGRQTSPACHPLSLNREV
jgi:hypothetical protein